MVSIFNRFSFLRNPATITFGIGLIVIGSTLFVLARHTLRKAYSGHLSVKNNQNLVRDGPYRLIRHPAYSGYLSMALGISIGYENLTGMLNIIMLLICMQYRMNLEEKMLVEYFGDAYRQYMQTTKRLNPGIW